MALYITEYAGAAIVNGTRISWPQNQGFFGTSTAPVVTTNVVSSGGTVSTIALQLNTQMIEIAATNGPGWVLLSASSISTSVATSTNAPCSPAGSVKFYGVRPGSRLTALST